MIFVTTGSQLPFDRLLEIVEVSTIDLRNEDVFCQSLSHIEGYKYKIFQKLSEFEFDNYFKSADLIISHAGVGTLLKAIEFNKPIIMIPRQLEKKEIRTDHQVSFCNNIKIPGVNIANNSDELSKLLSSKLKLTKPGLASYQNNITDFILNEVKDFL